MSLYVIRRPYGWADADELGIAAKRSRRVADEEMADDIRWIRSYVVLEEDGSLGTVCVYDASSAEKVREHADRADLPATEIYEVVDTVVVRPDPLTV
ncbi:MAG TPA: nickel-binding protein [Gaiellaceae bacterium]|nr:nickel-binding protein [Gaiellaceae bacterium]